jgi:hypothetical protein
MPASFADASFSGTPTVRPELNGFPVTRMSITDVPASIADTTSEQMGQRLFVLHGIADQRLDAGSDGTARVPGDAFGHTDPAAIVFLEARLVDGTPLPDWLQFNPVLGIFTGMPPKGLSGELEVEVIARDNMGREAHTTFHLDVDQVRVEAAPAAVEARDPTLGLDVDAVEKEKARRDAERARQAERPVGKDGKPVPRGAPGFDEQLRGAKTVRDPLLDRISKAAEQTARRSN